MKKVLILFALLLLCSFVVAEQEREQAQAGDGNATPMLISAQEQNRTGPVVLVGETLVHAGLNNALQQVKNENARAKIQRNMERFLEKYQARLSNMTDVEVEVDENTNETTIKEKKDVKFLGFIKGKATKTYKLDKDGNIREEHPWYRFMYTQPE